MPPSDLERLLGHVPGAGDIELERLSSGMGRDTYRVCRDGVRYAVKVRTDTAGAQLPQRRFESEVIERAAAAGISARLVAADADCTVLVLEWLEGVAMSESSAKLPDARLAALLRDIHALPLPSVRRVMSARDWVQHYDHALDCAARGVRELAGRAQDALRRLDKMQAAPNLCICHSDLHRLNVLTLEGGPRPGALALIDWEYSHLSEPFWDLAGWSANNDLEVPARHALLDLYLGRAASDAERDRLAALCWLYDYVCLQWIGLYVTRQPEPGASFGARAALLESRLKTPVYGTIAVPSDI
ncbi:MAG TPA: phosphotransferase [Steroidobacteraceae bacterium]|jgi:aminoglycoside phosphotransferase (APT) family kinase protein